jgi:hypothetical protein
VIEARRNDRQREESAFNTINSRARVRWREIGRVSLTAAWICAPQPRLVLTEGSGCDPHCTVLESYGYTSSITFHNTGYTQWTGFRTTAQQVLDLFQGLQNSGLDNFQYLLTGYLPDAATVAAVGSIAEKLKTKNSKITWSKLLF